MFLINCSYNIDRSLMPERINQGSRCIFPPPEKTAWAEAALKRPVEEYVCTLVVVGWRSHSSVLSHPWHWGMKRSHLGFDTFVMSWLAAKINTNRRCRRMQPPVNRLYLCLACVGGWRSTVRQRKAAPGAADSCCRPWSDADQTATPTS